MIHKQVSRGGGPWLGLYRDLYSSHVDNNHHHHQFLHLSPSHLSQNKNVIENFIRNRLALGELVRRVNMSFKHNCLGTCGTSKNYQTLWYWGFSKNPCISYLKFSLRLSRNIIMVRRIVVDCQKQIMLQTVIQWFCKSSLEKFK